MLQINTLARLDLGVKQENLARDIFIDMSAWMTDYPNGTVSIWHKRNGDQTKYATSATFDSDTNILTWTPTSYDTFYPGKGLAEIRLTEGGIIKKTKDIITETEKSLMNGSGETIESGWQTFLNTVEGYKNDAGTAKTGAEDAAEDAEAWAKGTRDGVDVEDTDPTYHNNAAYWAGEAAESAGDAITAAADAATAKTAAETAQGKAEAAEDRAESAVATIDASTEAAEAAATAAVNAKNDAVDAKTDAVSAKNTAVSAKNDAVSAKNDAVSAKNDAVSAKNTAVSAKDDAVSAKTDAVSAKNTAVGAKETAVSAKDDAVAAKEAAEAAIAHYPYVSTLTGTWMIWNPTTSAWVDTEVPAQGDTGAVPDISVGTVTTLQPDQEAYVTRRAGSTDEAPIFDFGIPKGDTGQAGNVYGSTVDMSPDDSTKVKTAIEARASKVSSATSGNFAGLDSNGDLVDSGHKHSDYLTSHQDISGKADKVSSATNNNFAALDANGNLKDSGSKAGDFANAAHTHADKADKVSGGTANNFAALDANGNLKDSGSKAGDFAAASHTHSGYAEKVTGATANNFAGLDNNGDLKDSGSKATDFAVAAAGLPTGGSAGYYLVKTGSGNYAVAWCSPDTVPMPTSPRLITSDAVATVDAKATLALNSIASEYNPTATYKKGGLIFYESGGTVSLMRCKGTTTGSFDLTKWEVADIGEAIQSVQESVEALIDDTAGVGDTDVTLSADKIMDELGDRDAAIAAVAGSVSIPVNGNTAPAAIASGKYIYLTGHSTLADGEYITTAAIAASESITSSNVDPVSDGAANALNSNLNSLGTVVEVTGAKYVQIGKLVVALINSAMSTAAWGSKELNLPVLAQAITPFMLRCNSDGSYKTFYTQAGDSKFKVYNGEAAAKSGTYTGCVAYICI